MAFFDKIKEFFKKIKEDNKYFARTTARYNDEKATDGEDYDQYWDADNTFRFRYTDVRLFCYAV